MTTSLTENVERGEDWFEPRSQADAKPTVTRAEWLWTLFGIALLVVFLFFVIDDYPLRSILAAN